MNNINVKCDYKIASITTIHNTMEWFVVPSMRNLHLNGFEISLICDMDDSFIRENSDYAKCYPIHMERGANNIFNMLNSIWKMYLIFSREKFDIIQYTSPNASFYAAIAASLARTPIRLYNQCGLRYVGFDGTRRKVFKFIETLTCKMSTHVRAQSPKNLDFAVEEKLCKSDKISVIGIGGTIGIDLNEFDLLFKEDYRNKIRMDYEISKESFVFGYVGRINKDKGLNELIRAFIDIYKEEPHSILMLVGMIDLNDTLEKDLLEWAKGSKSVIFTGNIPPKDVYKYMCAFDILTHPTYREGFGKVLQEAMGTRLPIITTDVPGPSEVVENGVSGLLVPVKDSYALKVEMLKLMRNPNMMERLAQSGRQRAEKFFDRNIMLENILEDTLLILKGNRN